MLPPRPARVSAPPPKSPRKPLTDEQCRIIREAILGGATRDEAATLAGIARRTLDTRLNDQLLDLRVGQGRQSPNRRRDERGYLLADEPDPPPELIALRCAEVRKSWGPERYLSPLSEPAVDDHQDKSAQRPPARSAAPWPGRGGSVLRPPPAATASPSRSRSDPR